MKKRQTAIGIETTGALPTYIARLSRYIASAGANLPKMMPPAIHNSTQIVKYLSKRLKPPLCLLSERSDFISFTRRFSKFSILICYARQALPLHNPWIQRFCVDSAGAAHRCWRALPRPCSWTSGFTAKEKKARTIASESNMSMAIHRAARFGINLR